MTATPDADVRAEVKKLVESYSPAAAQMLTEAATARIRYPAFNSPHEGYAVLAEEVDELWDEVKANQLAASIREAVQVGAMAMRYVTEMSERLAAQTANLIRQPRHISEAPDADSTPVEGKPVAFGDGS